MKKFISALATATILAGFALFSLNVNAASLSFTQITSNGPSDLANEFDVSYDGNCGANLLCFNFTKDDNLDYSIADIYFDGPTELGLTNLLVVSESAGVDFGIGANPSNLPGGNSVGFNSDASADSETPSVAQNGVDTLNELLVLSFNLNGATLGDVESALTSGGFVIGMHVQSIGQNSEGYISYIPEVPIPAAAFLFAPALLGFMGLRRKAKNSVV
jgi:hypothetical protein